MNRLRRVIALLLASLCATGPAQAQSMRGRPIRAVPNLPGSLGTAVSPAVRLSLSGGQAGPIASPAPVPGLYAAALRAPAPVLAGPRIESPVTALPASLELPPSAVTAPIQAGPASAPSVPGRLGHTLDRTPAEVFERRHDLDLPEVSRVFGGALELPAAGPSETTPAPETPAAKKRRRVAPKPSYDYARMFDLTRRLLTRPAVRKFLREAFAEELVISDEMRKEHQLPEDFEKIKEMSESQFLLLLQYNEANWGLLDEYLKDIEKKEDRLAEDDPKLKEARAQWRARFRELLKDEFVLDKFRKLNDPMKTFQLTLEGGVAGYSEARVYANHQRVVDGKIQPAEDLRQVVVDFIDGAEESLIFNVFDFDLEAVADAFIRAAKRGVKVTGGLDKSLITKDSDSYRPAVEAIFKKLSDTGGITMVAVDSVGLNHQKMIMRDHENPKKAKALFSSGNFTQSCIGPEGDLKDVEAKDRPRDSVPNANHILVMDSYLAAQVAAHNLNKTLVYKLRGDDYPLSGAFKVIGEKAKGAMEAPYIAITFSPKGGLGDVNRDATRRLILNSRGPLRLMQFAFSSRLVSEAIAERAQKEKKEGRTLDLKSVGDTPFAMRPWSVFLRLAGMALREEGDKKEYVELKAADNALRKALGEQDYEAVRKNLRIGPRAYRNHAFTAADGTKTQYGAKVHHKVIISGPFAVLGTSFNFSEAANSNQEQFLITNEPALVAAMNQVFDGLFALSATSVVDEALRRNEFLKTGGDDDLKIDKQYEHVDREAKKGSHPVN